MNEQELGALRRAYARRVHFVSSADDPRLEAALTDVRREDFMGPGPWDMPVMGAGTASTYRRTPDADPMCLYHDALVGLIPEKELNTGMPSFLTFLISLGRIAAGERAVHIGAGVGYYTAIIARLVGERGSVTAIEYEPELAARAEANLASYPQVTAVHGDGANMALDPADVILVNAGASHPADVWLDALNDGGRLIVPLAVGYNGPSGLAGTRGGISVIERHGERFDASWKSATAIYPCIGMSDAESAASLADGFKRGGLQRVRRLYRTADVPADSCWASGPGWALTYE
jgi:protein-L-isoaspartate(D-aspartate) O-methyltransferase